MNDKGKWLVSWVQNRWDLDNRDDWIGHYEIFSSWDDASIKYQELIQYIDTSHGDGAIGHVLISKILLEAGYEH